MNDLVRKLCEGDHPVEVSVRPERTASEFKVALDRGYVHIRFTETQGGTELGFKVDEQLSDLKGADFESKTGRIKVCGSLVLDFEKVRCVAEVDLSTLAGRGHLELLNSSTAQ